MSIIDGAYHRGVKQYWPTDVATNPNNIHPGLRKDEILDHILSYEETTLLDPSHHEVLF